MPKSWKEKLNPKTEPHVSVIDKPMYGFPPGSKLFVATPTVVKAYIESIPKGQTRTPEQMRRELAEANGADGTCSMTAGISARIAAEAALEDLAEGKSHDSISPFWRLIEPSSTTARKLSCGAEFVERMRASEGII